ncbi:MAG: 2-polyprenyl-3-methyl-6-methoxy-1,4-benzoquinone monooxygenase [Pseudomonadales bacterium]|nr:2-polyprenyl-3-methyl-6-methoxy-1,4-benzoquinone monooxygenase [Pseudomonadales bacterium]
MSSRRYTFVDKLIQQAENALKTVVPNSVNSDRPSPSENKPNSRLTKHEARHVAGLMRINHTGEVCAQALYQGQALTAHLEQVRGAMEQAAKEEEDHLAWCENRLTELGSHTSYLNPLFYGLSFGMGAAAGIIGDKWSLGFVAETEHQVVRHLDSHLQEIPIRDKRSRAILEKMKEEELHHATTATDNGGEPLPQPVKKAMSIASKVMTKSTYRI